MTMHIPTPAERDERDLAELRIRFAHHPPTSPDVVAAHQRVREACLDLALMLHELLPPGREKSQAITAVDDACMHANASIARTQLQDPFTADVTAALAKPIPEGDR